MNSSKREQRQEMLDVLSTYLKTEFVRFTERAISKGQSLPTQADFGRWLGVDLTTLSYWMTATRPPNVDNADAVASKLGPKIYEIMGIPPRMPNDKYLAPHRSTLA